MAEPENVEVPEQKKKRKLVPLLIIAATLGLLGGGGILVRNYMNRPKVPSQASRGATEQGSKVKSMMILDAFLVNLADEDAARFVKVTFRLGLDDPKSGEEYSSDPVTLAATRDRIISILSTKYAEDILSPEGKDKLRKEIIEKVNQVLPRGKVVEVFILDFVVQI